MFLAPRFRASILLPCLACAACSAPEAPGGEYRNDAGKTAPGNVDGSTGAGDAGSIGFGTVDGGASNASDDCPESAKLVYVTGYGEKLYSYYPPDNKFTLIGQFDCLTTPTHMTVDRQGTAWVVAGGRIYKASTVDAKCSEVSTWTANPFFGDFSLTFIGVTNAVDNTLYLLNDASSLVRFDVASGTVTPITMVEPAPSSGDMTSNGDGTLYFLDDVLHPVLWNFDPSTGNSIKQEPIDAKGGGSQALAYWGGRFYAFESNSIFEYDPSTKSAKPLGEAPLQVTGAGQSTCVPKVPPAPK